MSVTLVQRRAKPVVVLVGGAGRAACSASHHKPFRSEAGSQFGGAVDPVQLVGKDVRVDEVRPGVDACQFDAGSTQDFLEFFGLFRVLREVAVEHFNALVAG
jgi:hypothetical protein